MSINAFGKKNSWGNVTYGQVGVDIGELASSIAREMESKKAEMLRKQREDSEKPRESDPDVYFIARRNPKGYYLESVESYGRIGTIGVHGATIPIALANAKYQFVMRLQAQKYGNLNQCCERVSRMVFEVADVIDNTGLGSSTGKISVGSGD